MAALSPELVARFTDGAELCPHPQARRDQTFWVRSDARPNLRLWLRHPLRAARRLLEGPRPMGICGLCRHEFDRLIAAWAQGSVRAPEVRSALAGLGYSAADAEEFICDLEVV